MKRLSILNNILFLFLALIQPVDSSATVDLVAMEADNAHGKTGRLTFSAGGYHLIVHDQNGGSTLSIIYSLMMQPFQSEMQGMKSRSASRKWGRKKNNKIPEIEGLQTLLQHACNRIINATKLNKNLDREGLRSFKKYMEAHPEGITYGALYNMLGEWLQSNLLYLPTYKVETLKVPTYLGEVRLKLNQKSTTSDADNEINALFSTVTHLCCTTKFEAALPATALPLRAINLATILRIYHENRQTELDIREANYVTVRAGLEELEDGTIVETVKHIPKKASQVNK